MVIRASLLLSPLLLVLLISSTQAFPKLKWKTTARENTPAPELIGNIAKVSQLEAHFVDKSNYRFKLRDDNPYFTLDPRTSALRTRRPLDLEELCRTREENCDTIVLTVNVWDSRDSLKASVEVIIKVLDANDHSPIFEDGPVWTKKVREVLVRKGQKIELPVAYDNDWTARFNKVSYSIDKILDSFELKTFDDGRPYLLLTKLLDRETRSNYTFNLIARDSNGRQSSIKVVIIVLDVDDNPPKFTQPLYQVNIREDTKIGKQVFQLTANDPDEGKLTYEMGAKALGDLAVRSIFEVRPDGRIILVRQLDYERQKTYLIAVRVRDSVQAAQADVRINVLDVNDSPPEFLVNPARLSVMEESDSRDPIGEVTIFDKDEDGKATFSCQPSGNTGLIEFRQKRGAKSYDIIPMHSFDREHRAMVTAELTCWDKGAPKSLTSKHEIRVHVLDINDNSPLFNQSVYEARVEEEQPKNTFVIELHASDPDQGDNGRVTFALGQTLDSSESAFYIEPRTGRVTTSRKFDREERGSYSLIVIAHDHGTHPRTATARLRVTILDINDNAPKLTSPSRFRVRENRPKNTLVGDLTAEDADQGPNGTVRFTLAPPETQTIDRIGDYFVLLPNGSIFTRRVFDREARDEYCISVAMSDCSLVKPQARVLTACVRILDENDNKPVFTRPENESAVHRISVDDQPGQGILLVKAEDPDEGANGLVEYSLRNNDKQLFSVDQTTGEIKLRKMLTAEDKGDYKLGVMASDRGRPPLGTFSVVRIRVEDGPRRLFGTFDWHDNRNVLIVVILSTVSAFLAIVLISAIICMVRPCGRTRRSPNILYKPAAEDTWSPHSPDNRILQMPRVSNAGVSGPQANATIGMCVDSARPDCRGRLGSAGGSATMPRKARNPSNSLTRMKLEDGDPAVRMWPYDPERGRTQAVVGRVPGEHERDHSDSGRGGSEDDLSSRVAAAGIGPGVPTSGPVLQTFQTLDRHHGLVSQSPLHPGGPPHAGVRLPASSSPSALKPAAQVVHIPLSTPKEAAYTQLSTLTRRGPAAQASDPSSGPPASTAAQNNLSLGPATSTSAGGGGPAYERLQHRYPPVSAAAAAPVKETAILDASNADAAAAGKVDAHKLVEEIDNLFFKDMMV